MFYSLHLYYKNFYRQHPLSHPKFFEVKGDVYITTKSTHPLYTIDCATDCSATAVGMDVFNCVHLTALLLLLVCSSLSIANGEESHPVLKCNSYADAVDRRREKSSRVLESPFLLRVTRTEFEEYVNDNGFQYRGWFNVQLTVILSSAPSN